MTHTGEFKVKPVDYSLPATTLFGIAALFGLGVAVKGSTLASKCIGSTAHPKREELMRRINVAQDDPQYKRVKEAIEEARERIENGGGLGNQDADLLVGVEDGLEAAVLSGELNNVYDNLMATVDELGRSTQTNMP